MPPAQTATTLGLEKLNISSGPRQYTVVVVKKAVTTVVISNAFLSAFVVTIIGLIIFC
jgi:hypothetical protein